MTAASTMHRPKTPRSARFLQFDVVISAISLAVASQAML
jgi:hypothetical protein